MEDIRTRNDLEVILAAFYEKLLSDDSINYIFTEVANINIAEHLPVITDFWEQTIFHSGGYKNNVLQIHLNLNKKVSFSDTHFNSWLRHFNDAIDMRFRGENAEKMKTRALSIGTIMKIKMQNQ